MPVIKFEPTFAELVDNAAQRRFEDVEKWNQTIYNIYGSRHDPFTLFIQQFYINTITEKPKSHKSTELQQCPIQVTVAPTAMMKFSSGIYLFINGPFCSLRALVITLMILTLIFRLGDPHLQEQTATLSHLFDSITNIFFIIEGILRLLTLPIIIESRKQQNEQIFSLPYTLLRAGWLEILLSVANQIVIKRLDSSNTICWINYLRMAFVASYALSESPQAEVILVSEPPSLTLHLSPSVSCLSH
jgi:hypothetical protein